MIMENKSSGSRRILVVNPNTNAEITAGISKIASRILDRDCQSLVINPATGPRAIECKKDREIAEPLVIDLVRQHSDYDAYVMACFDDIGVAGARNLVNAPVIDAVEASVSVARSYGSRYAILTTVQDMVPGILTCLERLGALEECTVKAAGVGVSSAAAADMGTLARLDATMAELCADTDVAAVILGSGGLAGQAKRLSEKYSIPVIDCIEAAIKLANTRSRKPYLEYESPE
ncbi:Hydantoin racemase [Thalassovita gelatinovora]|uniref:Hydantoin racemase n=1 Tax=Thalassovita gelatinovora TaxID=53501 RepID=A0A0P1FTT8_THAGE|nr:aspartate/glutamate racemase family protein [Thalassovita gelatinovora]QIZ80914.1 Asp/Glu racemase [Thalassovita gelatinovora]CUH63408.1 Hydantoin racemase [Thalassovita gelatinovora]SEQ66533.1 allantoin racemase [Thalassovita gelatinovora]